MTITTRLKSSALLFSILFSMLFTIPAIAGDVDLFPECTGAASGSTICAERDSGSVFEEGAILRNGLQVFIFVVGFASVVMITVGGLKYVLSRGDPQATASARNTIIYAVAGLVVALASQGILAFVVRTVDGS